MSFANSNMQKVTLTVDLATLANTDQSASSGQLSSALIATPANGTTKKSYRGSIASILDMNANEGIIIGRVTISKTLGSATITSSSIANQVRLAKNVVTSGAETATPTVTQASEVTLAQLTLSNANVTKLETQPVTNVDLDASIGLKVSEQVLTYADIANGLSVYMSVLTAELASASATGTVSIDIFFRKVARA